MAELPKSTFIGTTYGTCKCCLEKRDVHTVRVEPYGVETLEIDLTLCTVCLRELNEGLDAVVLLAGVR